MDESKGLSCFLLGLGVGIGLGVVFAPKPGSEVRGLLREKALEGGDYLKRRTDDIRDSAEEWVDKGKSVVTRQKDQLSAAVDAGKQAYRETVSGSAAAEPTGLAGEVL